MSGGSSSSDSGVSSSVAEEYQQIRQMAIYRNASVKQLKEEIINFNKNREELMSMSFLGDQRPTFQDFLDFNTRMENLVNEGNRLRVKVMSCNNKHKMCRIIVNDWVVAQVNHACSSTSSDDAA